MKNTKVYIIIIAIMMLAASCVKAPEEVPASNTPTEAATAVPTAEPTPEPTLIPTPAPTQTPEPYAAAPDDGRPWYVRVDTYNQLISVYALDENGEYTRLINQFMTSAGKRDNYTKKVFQKAK